MAKKTNIFKLTDEDKKYLERLGHPNTDFQQIERAFNEVELSITDKRIIKGQKTRKCKQKRAIEVIGRETFLNGLSRAAFHATATRESSDEHFEIHFDLSHWWK